MSKISRRLVVDASVMRAAGQSSHPVASGCRTFLNEMRTICHRVVLTDSINREWKRHASVYASTWWASMPSKRKVVTPGATTEQTLHQQVTRLGLPAAQDAALHKDVMLLAAAVATDKVVVSLDGRARLLCARLAVCMRELDALVWVDPGSPVDDWLPWLRAGARLEAHRRLATPES